jgi:hypothetical protein
LRSEKIKVGSCKVLPLEYLVQYTCCFGFLVAGFVLDD